jgi:hypothetical protein
MASGPTAATPAATTATATAATSTKAVTAVPQMASEPTAAIPAAITATPAAVTSPATTALRKRKSFDWSTYRSQKYYKEQLKKLGPCHKIIEHWVGSRFTGRFESAIQVSGMGLIKPYGAR